MKKNLLPRALLTALSTLALAVHAAPPSASPVLPDGCVWALAAFALLVYIAARALYIGLWAERAGRYFSAYVAYGLAIMWCGQVLINVGVNIGLLPTKGLTLPFLSYGGSSLVVCCISLGLLLRIDWERRQALREAADGE